MKIQSVTIPIILSCLIHICIIILLSINNNVSPSFLGQDVPKKTYIPLKTVGIKNGKPLFSEKNPEKQNHRNKTTLSQLTPPIKTDQQKQIAPTPIKRAPSISPQKINQLQKVRKLALSQYSSEIRNQDIIKKTGFFFKFVPPKGIPEDELNSIEKIFYGFQKRTYQAYVSSLLSHYATLLTQRPYVEKTIFKKKQQLTGRIAIDIDGNITSVKFIQSSDNNDIQSLFEKTLVGIRSLPNPPKELLQGGEELRIYFQLIISD